MNLRTVAILSMLIATQAYAQRDLTGAKQFPQFRNLSGMPGCLFGVDFDGGTSFDGAMAISTPVGASLRGNRFAFGGGVQGVVPGRFEWVDRSGTKANSSNGTGFLMGGISLGSYANFTISDEILSTSLDHALNYQISPNLHNDRFGLAIGVQNAFDHMAAAGTNIPGDNARSRSYYGVVTYCFAKGSYVSLGHGDQRFAGLFGNVSYQLADQVKVLTEYDGFNFNSAVAVNAAHWNGMFGPDRAAVLTTSVGLIREKYPFWAVTLAF